MWGARSAGSWSGVRGEAWGLGISAGGGDGGAVVASRWDVGAWSVRQTGSINTSNARRVSRPALLSNLAFSRAPALPNDS